MSTIVSLKKAFYISMHWNSTIKGMKFGRGMGGCHVEYMET